MLLNLLRNAKNLAKITHFGAIWGVFLISDAIFNPNIVSKPFIFDSLKKVGSKNEKVGTKG